MFNLEKFVKQEKINTQITTDARFSVQFESDISPDTIIAFTHVQFGLFCTNCKKYITTNVNKSGKLYSMKYLKNWIKRRHVCTSSLSVLSTQLLEKSKKFISEGTLATTTIAYLTGVSDGQISPLNYCNTDTDKKEDSANISVLVDELKQYFSTCLEKHKKKENESDEASENESDKNNSESESCSEDFQYETNNDTNIYNTVELQEQDKNVENKKKRNDEEEKENITEPLKKKKKDETIEIADIEITLAELKQEVKNLADVFPEHPFTEKNLEHLLSSLSTYLPACSEKTLLTNNKIKRTARKSFKERQIECLTWQSHSKALIEAFEAEIKNSKWFQKSYFQIIKEYIMGSFINELNTLTNTRIQMKIIETSTEEIKKLKSENSDSVLLLSSSVALIEPATIFLKEMNAFNINNEEQVKKIKKVIEYLFILLQTTIQTEIKFSQSF